MNKTISNETNRALEAWKAIQRAQANLDSRLREFTRLTCKLNPKDLDDLNHCIETIQGSQ